MREIEEEIERFSDQIAAEMGPAPGSQTVSDDRKVELWGRTDPKASYDTIYGMLTTTGVPSEMLDPDGSDDTTLAIVKEIPELAPYYQQPVDPDVADVLATLAENPYRLPLLSGLEDDPEGQVKEAERLDALWSKRNGSMAYEPTVSGERTTGALQGARREQGAIAPMAPSPSDADGTAPVIGGY